MVSFQRDRSIFKNKDVLRESYQPESIQERDEEISEYMDALQPVIDGWEPNNIFLYGNTGVGKTAVTDHLLSQLQEDAAGYEDLSLNVVEVNCTNLNSSYQVAVEIVNSLRPSGGEMSPTGHSQQTVFNKLYAQLEELNGTVLIVLDEIDNIGSDDDILYELPRARANGHLENVKPGIIGVSNDLEFRDGLDPRVKDTLCEREIHFSPYNAQELENILQRRAERAMQPDVLDDGVVPLCAALAAKDRGSARQALDLLLLAGDIAQSQDDERVSETHVDAAQEALQKERVEEGMHELTQHGHLTLLAVVALAAEGETPERVRTIYQRYAELCDLAAVDPLSQRSIHNHLSDLRMFGILSAQENRTGSRGNYHVYRLDVPVSSALDALDAELHLGGYLRELRERLPEQ